MRLSLQVGAPNKGHVKESADSFTLGAHRGTIHCGQQASGSLASDAAHLQTDVVSPLTAYGVSAVVEAEPAVATAVDLADSDCSTEDAFDKTSAHSSGSPETAAIDGLPPVHGDTDSPTAAASSSGSQPSERHASTAEAGSSTQPSSDDSSAGAAHDASNGADQLAARGTVSSGDEGSQPTVSSFPQAGEGVTPAENPSSSLSCILVEGEKGAQPVPSSLPQGGEAHPPAVGSSATATAEQVSAFAWQAAQLQSVTHATNAEAAAPVSGTRGEDTMQRSGSSEATDVQSVVSSQQQASCLQQQQDSSNVTHEGGVESIANAQQSAEKQHTSSRAAFEEEAQPATAAAVLVQPHQSLQQSAAEEEEQMVDAATAREQQASSSTSKDEDDGDAAQRQISEEEQQQQLPGRSTGHDAHGHASTDVEDCKVPTNPSRQEEERIALLTQAKVEGQSSSSPDPVREEEEQGPSQLATEEDNRKIASSSTVREEEEQGLRQSSAQEDKQQTFPPSPLREEDKQAFSQSASEAAEEERRPIHPFDGAEQCQDTSGALLLSPSSPVSEQEAVHQLQTNSACDDMSFRADSSPQRKAKPDFLAKALSCSVAWPVLVPIVAFSSCIQLYDACSMTEVLRYTV